MNDSAFSNGAQLPAQLLVEAKFEDHALPDVAAETDAQLRSLFANVPLAQQRVAVAVGSRGIDQLATVVRVVVSYLKTRGAQPFIIPAMGSHGAATAEGQRAMLAALGVTEQTIAAPINADLETIALGQTESGAHAFIARAAYEADAVLLINRVKPHTDFASPEIGSGLRKMSVIGLGKADGAFAFHRVAARVGYEPVLQEVSNFVLSKLPHVFGLGLVEDAYHRLAWIEAMPAAEFAQREPLLLERAKRWMPRLPFKEIDVLIVDEIGKNISGAGMDTNIIERGVDGLPRPDRWADVRVIYARGLTRATHGNAIGLGFADVVSSRLVAEMDGPSTYTNALSAITPATVRIPMHFATDAECLRAALRLAGVESPIARVLRIRNTLALDRFVASANYAAEIGERADLQVLRGPQAWQFTPTGDFDSVHDLLPE